LTTEPHHRLRCSTVTFNPSTAAMCENYIRKTKVNTKLVMLKPVIWPVCLISILLLERKLVYLLYYAKLTLNCKFKTFFLQREVISSAPRKDVFCIRMFYLKYLVNDTVPQVHFSYFAVLKKTLARNILFVLFNDVVN
jgi:hypothetical protein